MAVHIKGWAHSSTNISDATLGKLTIFPAWLDRRGSIRAPAGHVRVAPEPPFAGGARRRELFHGTTRLRVEPGVVAWQRKAAQSPALSSPFLPLRFEIMPVQHSGKIFEVQRRLLAQQAHPLPVLVPAGLKTNGSQVFSLASLSINRLVSASTRIVSGMAFSLMYEANVLQKTIRLNTYRRILDVGDQLLTSVSRAYGKMTRHADAAI